MVAVTSSRRARVDSGFPEVVHLPFPVSLSDAQKKVFEDAAAKDKQRYEKELAAFKKTKE